MGGMDYEDGDVARWLEASNWDCYPMILEHMSRHMLVCATMCSDGFHVFYVDQDGKKQQILGVFDILGEGEWVEG